MEILDIKESEDNYKDIIDKARKFLIIVSPFFQEKTEQNFTKELLKCIECNEKIKKILFVYRQPTKKNGNNGIKGNNLEKIKEVLNAKNIDAYLYEFEFLHAKAVISDKHALISSLNFTDCSIENSNFEIGVKMYNTTVSEEDKKCYMESCLLIASNYNPIAENLYNKYKDNTRNYNANNLQDIKNHQDKKIMYDVKRNLEFLNQIDIEDLFFSNTTGLIKL